MQIVRQVHLHARHIRHIVAANLRILIQGFRQRYRTRHDDTGVLLCLRREGFEDRVGANKIGIHQP